MNREKYTDYLHRKIEYLEKTLFQVQDKYANFQQLVDKSRENEEKDVETCRKWILDQEQKDGKLQRELETLKAQIESLKKRSYEKSIDDQEGLIQKVEELGGNVEELKRDSMNSLISKAREHEGEMKVISEWIIKEEAKDWELMNTIDMVKLAIQNLKEEIDSGKVDQQLVLKSANIELKAIRGDFDESKMIQNNVFQRLSGLNARIDETEFYAKQMYREVGEQKFIIQNLAQENRALREENARFQKQISDAFRALREEIRSPEYSEFKTYLELKKAKVEDHVSEQPKSLKSPKSPAPIPQVSTNFEEIRQPNPSSDSVEITDFPSTPKSVLPPPSMKIVQEVLATWKLEDEEKKEILEEDPQKDIVSTVTISLSPFKELPIQEAIIGEWKLVSSGVQQIYHETDVDNIKIDITGSKLTTYFNIGTNYMRSERFEIGDTDSVKNYWYIHNDSVISVDFKGYCKKTEFAERCTRSMQNGRLLMMIEIGGLIYSRIYERM